MAESLKKYFYTYLEHGVYYTKEIIESLMTLLYEHKVTIKKSDYSKIMAAAETLGFDKLIKKGSQ